MLSKSQFLAGFTGIVNAGLCFVGIALTRAIFSGHDAEFWYHAQIAFFSLVMLLSQLFGFIVLIRPDAKWGRLQLYIIFFLAIFIFIRAFSVPAFWLLGFWCAAVFFAVFPYAGELQPRVKSSEQTKLKADLVV